MVEAHSKFCSAKYETLERQKRQDRQILTISNKATQVMLDIQKRTTSTASGVGGKIDTGKLMLTPTLSRRSAAIP